MNNSLMTATQRERWNAIKARVVENKAVLIEAEKAVVVAERTLVETVQQARAGLIASPVPGGAWDAAKRYTKDDTVTYGGLTYIALRYSCGIEPGTSALQWAAQATAEVIPAWEDLDGIIFVGTKTIYGGIEWICSVQHIKSAVNKPKEGALAPKWQQVA